MTNEYALLRVFFAIELPLAIKDMIAHSLLPKVQKKVQSPAIRWTHADKLHITLQFLPSIKRNDIEKLVNNVKIELENYPEFHLEFGALEFFPSTAHPQIISLQVGPDNLLQDLVAHVGHGIVATNYPVETRPFRGHLTLGRLNGCETKSISFEDIHLALVERISVSEIILFQSELRKEKKANYIPLARIELSSVPSTFVK